MSEKPPEPKAAAGGFFSPLSGHSVKPLVYRIAPSPVPFRFSDKLFSDANFTKWLFLLISGLPSMPLQDAGQLLPATRSQL
ncbi:TPA: hypothetical protein ACSRG2_005002 [Klebsiella pneumoniae]|uniref:hypothetical protein n=1 Tax=Klebsiella pneumoniae TaxID=573 RepID=UPI003FA61119